MAFTGIPVVTKVTDGLARITGVSLDSGDDGVIGLFGSGAEVELPEGCIWISSGGVGLQSSVQVLINPVTDVEDYAIPIRVVKTGVDVADFAITLTNDAAQVASAELEIYVRYH